MEEVLKAAAQQAPSLVVLVVLVWFFLRSIERKDQAAEKRDEAFLAAIKLRDEQTEEIQRRCHHAKAAATKAMQETAVEQRRLADSVAPDGVLMQSVRQVVREELRERQTA